MAVVSFDFDETICGPVDYCPFMLSLLKNHLRLGDTVMILTARMEKREYGDWYKEFNPNRIPVKDYLHQHGIDVPIVYTNHDPKGPHAKRLGVDIHYDNDATEIASCREYGVIGIPIGYDHEQTVVGD